METLTWVKPLPEHLDLQLAVVEVRGSGLQTQVAGGDGWGRPRGGGDGWVSGGGGGGGRRVEGGRGGKRELVGEVFGRVRRRGF